MAVKPVGNASSSSASFCWNSPLYSTIAGQAEGGGLEGPVAQAVNNTGDSTRSGSSRLLLGNLDTNSTIQSLHPFRCATRLTGAAQNAEHKDQDSKRDGAVHPNPGADATEEGEHQNLTLLSSTRALMTQIAAMTPTTARTHGLYDINCCTRGAAPLAFSSASDT